MMLNLDIVSQIYFIFHFLKISVLNVLNGYFLEDIKFLFIVENIFL